MTKHHYVYHWFKGCHSTMLPELPPNENTIGIYARKYWQPVSLTRELTQELKADSEYFAFVRMRDTTPNVFGEGKTMDEAVDSLVDELVAHGT